MHTWTIHERVIDECVKKDGISHTEFYGLKF